MAYVKVDEYEFRISRQALVCGSPSNVDSRQTQILTVTIVYRDRISRIALAITHARAVLRCILLCCAVLWCAIAIILRDDNAIVDLGERSARYRVADVRYPGGQGLHRRRKRLLHGRCQRGEVKDWGSGRGLVSAGFGVADSLVGVCCQVPSIRLTSNDGGVESMHRLRS